MTADTSRELAQLDTCAISDALDRLGLPGVVVGIRAMSSRRRIAGRVVTVQLEPAGAGPADQPAAGSTVSRHLATAAVAAAGPGDIIVIAHGGRLTVAGWGGILSLAASVRGVEGVIVDGACRDLDEAIELDFPVYAAGAVPTTARGRVREASWNRPITVAGVGVRPGDCVIADASGVVFIPADRLAEILAAAGEIVARERAMADAVRAGRSVTEVMGTTYEQLLGTETRPPA